jgi:hypothetical protein
MKHFAGSNQRFSADDISFMVMGYALSHPNRKALSRVTFSPPWEKDFLTAS